MSLTPAEPMADNKSSPIAVTPPAATTTSEKDGKKKNISKEKNVAKDTATTGEKQLSNKELKELKKKEKAAKRAAVKEASGTVAATTTPNTSSASNKNKATATQVKKQLNSTKIKEVKKIPSLFSHLETREQRNSTSPKVANIIHPIILKLTIKFSTYSIVGSIPRCKAMLEAFKQVIHDYTTPDNTTLTRNLTSHLSHQIEYLKTARPLSISMGNSIRWLKQEISHVPIDTNESEAKTELINKIDDFLKEKIEYADRLIISNASKHILNDSTILTYGHSQVLEKLFLHCCLQEQKSFKIIIVDSRPLFEGKRLAKNLINHGLNVQYVLINSLASVINDVDTVFLGAHSMLSNGRLYSRVGTALVAMSSHSRNIPVLICCESIKFSDKVQLDSVTTNELADSNDLIRIDAKPPNKNGVALEQFIKSFEDDKKSSNTNGKNNQQQKKNGEAKDNSEDAELPLKNWENVTNLNLLNIMYDLTPPEYIKKIITEVGSLPPSSVPVILREYKDKA